MNKVDQTEQEICQAIHDGALRLYTGLRGENYPRILVVSEVMLLLKRTTEYCQRDFLTVYQSMQGTTYGGTEEHRIETLKAFATDLVRYHMTVPMDKWSVSTVVAALVWRIKTHYSGELTEFAQKDTNPPNKEVIAVVGIWPTIPES